VCWFPPPQKQQAVNASTPLVAYIWKVSRVSHIAPGLPPGAHHCFFSYVSHTSFSLSTQPA
jgi:hypothetical protein